VRGGQPRLASATVRRYVRTVPRKRIVAVFGGSKRPANITAEEWDQVLNDAQCFGALIADEHLLLTGGTRPGTSSVKGCAISGAGSKPWLGVSPKAPNAAATSAPKAAAKNAPTAAPTDSDHHVIPTGLGHQRNYVEATLCDAVIALAGGDGTVSEVTCALSLERPVLFVGRSWRNRDRDLTKSAVLDRMVQITLDLFDDKEKADAQLNQCLRAYLRGSLNSRPECRYIDGFNATGAAEEIAALIGGAEIQGYFPALARIAPLRADYERWLARRAP
jgi:predicted Rossmann-fold nucleotide-binding protein